MLETRALAPFGRSVSGVDITRCDEALSQRLARTVAQSKVLVLRDQQASNRQFVAFLKSLGPMAFTKGEIPVEGASDLNLVTNVGRTRAPRSVFHTDTSYVAHAPALTALMAVQVPRRGGETLFTDQVAALGSLPAGTRARIEGRTICHAYAALGAAEEASDHPAILPHPLTGERALYLSTPERCVSVSGVPADEGAALIAALYAHSTREENVLRHSWQAGDIVLWDNRLTMHRADHSAVEGARVLHRGLVARLHVEGERP